MLLSVPAASAAPSNEFLTKVEKKHALRAIDTVCGDTWCSGDYNFRFNQIYCSRRTKTCRVVFQYFPHGEPEKARGLACDVSRVSKFLDIVYYLRPGVRSLQDKVYQQLNNCMTRHRL